MVVVAAASSEDKAPISIVCLRLCVAVGRRMLMGWLRILHYYRMDLLSRAVTAFSPGYRAGTTISELKVEPSVPGHRAGTKEGPLVPDGVTNRD